jgi:hypothetical protein
MIEKPGKEPVGADLPFPSHRFPGIIVTNLMKKFEAISSYTVIDGGGHGSNDA